MVKKEKLTKKQKQLIGFFITIIAVFAVFFGTYWYIQSLKSFDYAGIEWTETKYSNLNLYHGIVSLGNVNFNAYFRTDPRENNISVNASFKFYPNVVVAISPAAGRCPEASGAQLNLGQFLGAAGRNVSVALTDKETAKAMNLSYANCSSAINKTVIVVQESDIPSVQQQGDCYIINTGRCENLPAVERFITAVIAQVNNVSL